MTVAGAAQAGAAATMGTAAPRPRPSARAARRDIRAVRGSAVLGGCEEEARIRGPYKGKLQPQAKDGQRAGHGRATEKAKVLVARAAQEGVKKSAETGTAGAETVRTVTIREVAYGDGG